VAVWTGRRPTSLRAQVLCLVLRESRQKDVREAQASRAHLLRQSWHWKECVVELRADSVLAGWLCCVAGESQIAGLLCL
jgi:hypothetical protein